MVLSTRKIGHLQIILSGVCFGFLGFFGKMAYSQNIAPGELLSLRYLVSAIFTGLVILITSPKSFKSLGPFEITLSLLLGIFGYALFSSFYFIALTGLSASLTVLLLYTYPVIVTLFSRLFFNEKIGRLGFLALTLVCIGIIGLVWGEWNIRQPQFLLFGLGASVFYSLYIILSRKYLEKVSPLPSSFYVQIGAAVVLSVLNFKENYSRPFEILQQHYSMIFSMSILCSLIAMTLFLAGLQKIKSSEASILSMSEPISGVIIASLLLGERIHLIQIGGGVLVLSGMILISMKNQYES